MIKRLKIRIIAMFFNRTLGLFFWVTRHMIKPEHRAEKIKEMYDHMCFTEEDMDMLVEEYLNERMPLGNMFILESLNRYYKD